MVASETATANIVEICFDALKNPHIWHLIDNKFCSKYKLRIGAYIIVDVNNHIEGNVILLKSGIEYYIAQYFNKKLVDIADGKELIFKEKSEIIGAVYCRLEHF